MATKVRGWADPSRPKFFGKKIFPQISTEPGYLLQIRKKKFLTPDQGPTKVQGSAKE